MKQVNDSEIRHHLKISAENLELKEPSVEQDRIFQKNLESLTDSHKRGVFEKRPRWFVAASFALTIGLATIFLSNSFHNERVSDDTSILMASSKKLEQQLSGLDMDKLNPKQYAEYVRLRLEIEQIDQQLNQYYLSDKEHSQLDITYLWKRRVSAAKSLKSIQRADSLVARI